MRALMLDPDVILLDEPMAATGPAGGAPSLQAGPACDLPARLGKTVVLVTHD